MLSLYEKAVAFMKILFKGFAYACWLDAYSFWDTSEPGIVQFYNYDGSFVFQCQISQIEQIFDEDDHILYDCDSDFRRFSDLCHELFDSKLERFY